jgi:hypothetical protein
MHDMTPQAPVDNPTQAPLAPPVPRVWHTPQIQIVWSIVPGDVITFDDDSTAEVVEHVATWFEDLRPGKEGKRAPKMLVQRP